MKEAQLKQIRDLLPKFCPIPRGIVLMGTPNEQLSDLARQFGGTRESYAEEAPQHPVEIAAFAIAQVPVTNALYAEWIKHSGQRAPIVWHGSQPPAELANYPVVDVTWDEAVACCDWLSSEVNLALRLPSEAEWERAARGDDTRIYPWGDQADPTMMNIKESMRGGLALVGSYPQAASPFGVYDLAGNIWEWTSSLQKSYPYNADDGREARQPAPEADRRRIMRGGCWGNPGHFARNTCRFRLHPERSTHLLGFRLAYSLLDSD